MTDDYAPISHAELDEMISDSLLAEVGLSPALDDDEPAVAAPQGGGGRREAPLPPQPSPENLDDALEEVQAEIADLQVAYDRVRPAGDSQPDARARRVKRKLTEARDRERDIQTRQRENVYGEATTMLVDRRWAKWTAEAEREVDREIKDLQTKAERAQGTEANLAAWDRVALAQQKRPQLVESAVARRLATHTTQAEAARTWQRQADAGIPPMLRQDAGGSGWGDGAQELHELAEEYRAARTTLSVGEWMKRRKS